MECEKQWTNNEMLILQSNEKEKASQIQINNGYFNMVGDSSVLQFLKNKGHSLVRPRSMAHCTMTQDTESLWSDAYIACINLALM